ncbi:MAG: mevalonate kinase [Clostridia bacterium]
MAFVGSGRAKLILFGEHAVVHGHPALGVGLPGQLTVSWTPGGNQLVLNCPEEYKPSIRLAFQRIAAHFELEGSGRTSTPAWGLLEFESDIPVSAGLGSSGAVCVAMARAIAAGKAAVPGIDKGGPGQTTLADEAAIWAAAHDGERVFHGRPSGVDTGLALWHRLCLFTPQAEGLPAVGFLPGMGINLVYGTVPREASCAANVAAIGKAMAAGDTGVSAALAELGRLTSQAASLLARNAGVLAQAGNLTAQEGALSIREGDLSDQRDAAATGLGTLANAAMSILRNLDLSTPAMNAILAAGLAAGATGGKLSGGGAGGAFWLACPAGHDALQVQTAVMAEAQRLGLPGNAFTGVTTI